MYIAPSTNVKLLHGVPLDNTYEHTIYFESVSDQTTYFTSKTKYNCINFTYQRVNKGVMRVGYSADNIYDCNYLMFQNTNFGNKWFYAFINSVEYINNDVAEIQFEIDDIQTWFFDFDFNSTYVLRQHSYTDIIGENILPEPVMIGEYWHDSSSWESLISRDFIYIVAVCDLGTPSSGTGSIAGKLYNNMYGACTLRAFRSGQLAVDNLITTFLSNYIAQPDAIVSIYTCPSFLVHFPEGVQEYELPSTFTQSPIYKSMSAITGEEEFKGYTPKNKKLYTYPYNFYQVYTNTNHSLNLRYEFFFGFTPKVLIEGCITEPVKTILRPYNYQGFPTETELGGINEMTMQNLTLDDYPKCSFAVDTYKQWVAQRSMPILLDFLTPAVAEAVTGGGLTIKGDLSKPMMRKYTKDFTQASGNLFSEQYTASIQADQCRGSYGCGSVDVQNLNQGYYGVRTHLNFNDAKCIDDFFSKYGYACKEITTPNRHSRPHWNYVQTMNCTIVGSMPADSESHICDIHDKGITYWRYGDEVGHYELDNSPTVTQGE